MLGENAVPTPESVRRLTQSITAKRRPNLQMIKKKLSSPHIWISESGILACCGNQTQVWKTEWNLKQQKHRRLIEGPSLRPWCRISV